MRALVQRAAVCLAAGGMSVVIVGCGSAPPTTQISETDRPGPGGALSVIGGLRPPRLDPHRVTSDVDALAHRALFRQLYLRVPGRDEPQPDLAVGAPRVSRDGLTVTVTLRRSVRFGPSGGVISADDVKRGIERALRDRVAHNAVPSGIRFVVGVSPGATGPVAGISSNGPNELAFTLTAPRARDLITALATPATTPIPGDPSDPSIFSGPYVPRPSGVPLATSSVRLQRNPAWRPDTDPRPAFADRITFVSGRDPRRQHADRVLDGRGGMLVESPPTDVVATAEQRSGEQVTMAEEPRTQVISIAPVGELQNPDVRRALVAVTNRERLLKLAGERGALASHYLPPGVAGHDESGGRDGTGAVSLREPAGDLRAAQALLRSAGYVEGRFVTPLTLVAVRPAGTRAAALGRSVQTDWARLGVRLVIKAVDARTLRTLCWDHDAGAGMAVKPPQPRRSRPNPAVTLPSGRRGRSVERSVSVCIADRDEGEGGGDDPGAVLAPVLRRLPSTPIAAAARDADRLEAGPLRARAWAGINRALVDQALGVPWRWDQRALLVSRDVLAAIDVERGTWDLPFTSLDRRSR